MQEWEELLARAEGGDRTAQVQLADCYAQGRGVERSPAQAAAWLRRAAEQGSPEGQSIFGFCCLEGFGVKKMRTRRRPGFGSRRSRGAARAGSDWRSAISPGRVRSRTTGRRQICAGAPQNRAM